MLLLIANSASILFAEETVLRTVSADDFFSALEQKRSEDSGVVLDVRTPGEYADGNAPSSINIDFYASDFKDKISALEKDETYFLYCRSGNRSGRTLKLMKSLGYTHVYDLSGGWSGHSSRLLGIK